MTHFEDHSPREETYTQSLAFFDREAFINDALAWGHTPIKNLPEQAIVCERLLDRIISSCPPDVNPLAAEYMATVYGNRFHVRQDRNAQAYESRLDRTPYAQLSPEVRARRDSSMIGAASIRDSLLFQKDVQMGSNEIARNTNAFSRNTEQCQDIRNEILEVCYEMDDTSLIPDTQARWKVRGSDMITFQDIIKHDGHEPYYLFITSKEDCVTMPQDDTRVLERHSYVLDLESFARHEPEVAKKLRSFDVVELGPEEWMRQATLVWADFAAANPVLNDQSIEYLYDQSTTFYTVSKTRLGEIAERDELLEYRKALHPAGSRSFHEHIAQERVANKARNIGGVATTSIIDDIMDGLFDDDMAGK
jgi:hypothetical protein